MNDFVPAIISLRTSPPNELIAKLHSMFQTITKMDSDEIVAAHQTVKTTAKAMNIEQDFMIQTLLEALIVQMHAIGSTLAGIDQINRFSAVTGGEFSAFGKTLKRNSLQW